MFYNVGCLCHFHLVVLGIISLYTEDLEWMKLATISSVPGSWYVPHTVLLCAAYNDVHPAVGTPVFSSIRDHLMPKGKDRKPVANIPVSQLQGKPAR